MRGTAHRRRVFAAAVALMLVGAGSASAAISRQQAYRLAKQGTPSKVIVKRAFPGTKLIAAKEAPIRVLLAENAPSVVVTGQTPLLLTDLGNPAFSPLILAAEHRYQVKRSGADYIVVDLDAGTKVQVAGPVQIHAQGAPTGIHLAEPTQINRRYRGALVLWDGEADNLSVNNVVNVEAYLLGTLPGDMPASWGNTARGAAALRAGAIALRSRALAQRKLPTANFDFFASDPLYLGLDGERPTTSLAVSQTRYLMLRRNGFAYPASFGGVPAMGSTAFQPKPGTPRMVAFGPEKPVLGAASGKAQAALDRALGFIGVPYLWGGTSPSGFDCSGLTYFVYKEQGITLPRVAADQARVGTPIKTIAELLPGDTVFFADSSGYIHHMGLYKGDGWMVHAPRTGTFVRLSHITSSTYYTSQFAGGRRYSQP